MLLGAAPLFAVLALAEAPGAGPGWAATQPPVGANGKAAASTVAGAGQEPARSGAAGGEAGAAGEARLRRTEVPAVGRQETILSVERFGRYSVRAASRQGTAVRVIDRMAGELGDAGEAGRENGRIDLFLDRGDYQVVTESHVHGEGTAKLSVEPFRDAHGASAARGAAALELVERKLVTERLDDLRQLPYWLRLADRREVRLEAAGRNLADLRLWRDGSWLEDVEPSCGAIQPVTGQPLLRCEIAATLPAGLYLVVLYGGPPQPWSEDAAEHPLYLRWGYPLLADAGRRRYEVSPFGEDRFELPANVNYVRIELPQARPAWLTAGWASSGRLLSELAAAGAATAEVKKNSVPPVAAVRVPERPSASAEKETGRRSGGATPAPAARGAEPSITGETAHQTGDGTPAEGGEDSEGGEGSAPSGDDTLSNAGAAAMPAGAPGSTADDTGADETAQEGAPGAAMPEPAGATEAALPAPAGGGEEMAGDAADETAAGAPQAVQPPAEGATMPETAENAETGSEAGDSAQGAQGQAATGTGAPGHEGPRLWVSVRGTPGQPYVLQHFERKDVYTFRTGGRYWISTVHSGDPHDSVDATAVLTSQPDDGSERERLEKAAAVPIDSQHAWARRFNLLGRLELFLEVGEQGTYEVVSAGGDGRFRIEPFLTSRPEKYKAPDFKRGGSRWELDRGLYVLTAAPSGRGGIVTMGVRPAGKFADLLVQAAAPGAERDPVRASARFVEVPLQGDRHYTLYLNRQPGVVAGAVLRPWPVDLGQPLPVTQRPGEVLALNFTVAAAGTLRAEAEDGQALEAMVDGGPWQTAVAVTAGGHLAQIRQPATPPGNPGAPGAPGTVSYSLWVEPQELAAAAPLPPLPAAALAALPKFPELRPGSPRFIDLARGAGATFLVKVDKPALYQLQTTGVLATRAALRTRTVTSLAAGSANGVGRNALVRQYLREGDFQATVTTEGRSQGHLGVELRTTQLIDGGELRPDAPARITMPAGQGVVYRFTITQPGEYRLLAMGLGFVYGCRLEDAAGWPIEPPNIPADLSRKLAPGAYRLVLLPQPIGGRAVTLLSRRREALHFVGHGPHPLPLGTTVTHLWREPEGVASQPDEQPAQRPPDLWRFDLPAAATATITLDAEMQGTLTRLDAAGAGTAAADAAGKAEAGASPAGAAPAELGQVPPGRALSLGLPAGHYQLAVVCSRRNSLVRYRVRVATAELVEGEEPLLTAPVTLKVSVGGAGLVEISSYSAADVRARLYAADGRLVADEDDRPDDWNFLISERLPAGRYRLEIEPVGRRSAKLRLAMRTAAEVEDRPLALPYRGDVELAGEVRLLPLVLPRQGDLLLVAARSQENVGLGLEVREGPGWRLLGSSTGREPRLEVPLPLAAPGRDERAANAGAGSPSMAPAAGYRVRLWSLERRGAPVRLAAAAVTAPRIREGQLAKGAALPLVPGIEPPLAPLAAAVIEIRQPGLVRLQLAGRTERPGESETRRATRAAEAIPPASAASPEPAATAKRPHAGRPGGDDAASGGSDAGAPDGGDTGDHREGWRGGSVAGQVLAPLSSVERVTLGALRQSGGRIWLVAEAPRGAPRLRGERLELPSGLDRAVRFHLPAPAAPPVPALAPAPPPRQASPALPAPPELSALSELPVLPEPIRCDLDRGRGHDHASGPVLAMVTALAGQPAVRVVDAAAADATSSGNAGSAGRGALAGTAGALAGARAGAAAMLAIGPRSAVSVALSPRRPSAEVWDADPGVGGAAAAPEVRLAQLSFSPPRPETAAWGVTGGSVSGLEARQFELPAGAKKIRLSLGPALVAVLSDGDTATSTHWQGGLPFEELLDGGATRLTLLHTASGSDPFTFELLPRAAGEEELVLPPATPFVRSFDRAGTLRLRLPDLPTGTAAAASARGSQGDERRRREWRYRVWSASLDDAGELGRSPAAAPGAENGVSRGDTAVNPAAADAVDPAGASNGAVASSAADIALIDGAGHVSRGAELAGAPGGYLLIHHGPGVVAAWVAGLLEPGQEPAAGEKGWQAPLAAPATAVTPPATVPLAGRFVHLTLAGREPAVLHLRAAAPALTLLAGAGGETVAIHPAGVRLDAYLLPGVTHLGFSALGEGALGGFAELTTTPVTPTGEGLGPEVLLPPGDTRWFSFHVAARRRVGWGAAAGAERVSCRLLQADGRAVAPGSPGGQGAAGISSTAGSARPPVSAHPVPPVPAVPPAPSAPSAATARADLLQMAELEAGDYLLVLTAPPDSAPLRVRPVVVGLDLPDTGPPPEVIRHYLQEAGAVPAADPGSHP